MSWLRTRRFKLSGVLTLFNNLLQSLFKSQILTLGYSYGWNNFNVFNSFRNITLALIGVVPNFMAAFLILGIIGLLEKHSRYDDNNNCSNNHRYHSR